MTDHERAAELLTWQVIGRLSGDDLTWLSTHLEGCAHCRELFEHSALLGRSLADAAAAVIALVEPIQKRFAELAADPSETARLLGLGATKARAIADPTMARARAAIGLTAPLT